MPQFAVQVWPVPGGVLPNGAPSVLKRGPADAVLELKAIVLLTMFTAVESISEIPAPSQPATLSAMMLLVTVTVFHCLGFVGKATISEPLAAWKAIPPPLPDERRAEDERRRRRGIFERHRHCGKESHQRRTAFPEAGEERKAGQRRGAA